MQLFQCEIVEAGWCTEYVEIRTHILAENEEEARTIFCNQYGFRKNKKGMRIRPIAIKHSQVIAKTQTELIHAKDYRPGLGEFDASHYGKVTRYYCSNCNSEVKLEQTFCNDCGSNLIKNKKNLEEKL